LSTSSSDNILDRLEHIEARLSAIEARPSVQSTIESVLNRRIEDLRLRLHAEMQEALTIFEGTIDNKVSLHISKVEKALIEQSVVITTLSQRAVDSEINLQRLISAVEKLFERSDPAKTNPPDSVFRPRIVKEDDKKPRHRTPLTSL
jgi:uncharacterized coiled-coil protein SlyX